MDKVPLSAIETSMDGQVNASDGALTVVVANTDATTPTGTYDGVAGTLVLTLPEYGAITVSGFPRLADLGQGPSGRDGAAGSAGLAGLTPRDGRQGSDGCIGQIGEEGKEGRAGARGVQGPQGATGPTGPRGLPGKEGKFAVYFQADDPGAVGAGAIWIRPRAAT